MTTKSTSDISAPPPSVLNSPNPSSAGSQINTVGPSSEGSHMNTVNISQPSTPPLGRGSCFANTQWDLMGLR